MTERDEVFVRDPTSVPCTMCHAEPGEACRFSTDGGFHASRWVDAMDQKSGGASPTPPPAEAPKETNDA